MEKREPLISIIVPTYNRENTLGRTLRSILQQTYRNFEIIVVDDGSTDNTASLLKHFEDARIKIVVHPKNKGVAAAKNTGLDHINGEWFSILDSDDEIVPEALERMISIPLEIDPEITAVSCNCLDSITNTFTGSGVTEDQYLSVDDLMTRCRGEFWGLTKSSLLSGDRFNEHFSGWESILWYKIDDRAKRYYTHQALRIYHTEGDDRVSLRKFNPQKEANLYRHIILERHYLSRLEKYMPEQYYFLCRNGLVSMNNSGEKAIAGEYFKLLSVVNMSFPRRFTTEMLRHSLFSRLFVKLKAIKSGL